MKRFSEYLKEELTKIELKEGLIASYDTPKLIDLIKNKIGNKISDIDFLDLSSIFTHTKYGEIFTVNIYLNNSLTDIEKRGLNQLLELYGYTNSLELINDLELQIEPKYPVKLNGLFEKLNVINLYHITKKIHINKIKNIGLTPRGSQTTYEHPNDRIYLLAIINNINVNEILNSFIRVLSKNKGISPEEMFIIKTKYNTKHNYYLDDTTFILQKGIIGIFTTSNIKNTDIQIIEK